MMRDKTDCPCKGCTDRTEFGACHDTCEKYIDWKKKVQEYNNKVKANWAKVHDASEFKNRKFKGWNKA